MPGRIGNVEELKAFIDELSAESWLGSQRAQWPRYLFHVTDVHNVVNILSSGMICCRSEAIRRKLMVVDNASRDVINQTDRSVHNLARFYFRPRTPTFFNNEGIRPIGNRQRDAHCPIPVAMLFDAVELLSRHDAQISDGNRANSVTRVAQVGSGVEFIRSLPFSDIYHDGPFGGGERDLIVFRRQAEVCIPHCVDLSSLRHVFVRSPAELITLRSLLHQSGPEAFEQYKGYMRVNAARNSLFFRRWSFVETVSATANSIVIGFNPSTETPGPFTIRLGLEQINGTMANLSQELRNRQIGGASLILGWPGHLDVDSAFLRIQLDDSLAFFGKVTRSSTELMTS